MSVIFPIALLLLPPLAAAFWALGRADLIALGRLPGAWGRIVSPSLKGYLAERSARIKSHAPALCLGVAALIALALARPGVVSTDAPDYANIAGRVIVVDVSADLPPQTVFISALLDQSPHIPTALIAAAGESYLIVPFTTDRAQIARYLNAIRPDIFPVPGRSLHLGLARAEKALRDAGVLVGQVLVTSSGEAPVPVAIAETETMRVVLGGSGAGWADYADAYQAEVGGADPAPLIAAIEDAARAAAEASLPGARWDLTPWLIGAALLLWLTVFRRRSA